MGVKQFSSRSQIFLVMIYKVIPYHLEKFFRNQASEGPSFINIVSVCLAVFDQPANNEYQCCDCNSSINKLIKENINLNN